MRASGTGRDSGMTIIPIAILVLFAVIVAGGPYELLAAMEGYLRAAVTWVTKLSTS